LALRALYIWHREGKHGLPDRESLPRKVGTRKKESTLHDVINELGARLGIPLLEQSPSPRGFWRLTELGAQLAAGAQKILAVLDDRLNTVKALGALDISRLQALEQELNVTLLEKAGLAA
jgi:DNA-binding transcriptional LysR family regulator